MHTSEGKKKQGQSLKELSCNDEFRLILLEVKQAGIGTALAALYPPESGAVYELHDINASQISSLQPTCMH
jgi:hypothetical protein